MAYKRWEYSQLRKQVVPRQYLWTTMFIPRLFAGDSRSFCTYKYDLELPANKVKIHFSEIIGKTLLAKEVAPHIDRAFH